MSAGDLFSLRDQMTYLGQPVENQYFILQSVGAGGFSSLAVAWAAGPQVNVKSVVSAAVVFDQMVIVNLDDTTDFGIVGSAGVGVRPGQGMPPYAAWAFRLQTTDRRIRTGTKRFGGISESDQDSGVRDAGIVAAMDGLENALESTFAAGGDTFKIVLHTEGNIASGGSPLTVAVSVVNYANLSTQSSRKFS